MVLRSEYGPFGEVIRATGPMAKANPFRFSTKYQDDETDLFYYGYRYYGASTGRWLSRDPMEEKGGKNLYVFVANAPSIRVDVLGRNTVVIQFAGSSTTINGNPDGASVCSGDGIDIVFTIANSNENVNEYNVKNYGQFFCDGEPAIIYDYQPIVEPGKAEGGQWKVKCHSKTPFCPKGKYTGHTRLTMNGQETDGGPFVKAGEVDADWTYFCNTCCYQEGNTQLKLKRLYPADQLKRN